MLETLRNNLIFRVAISFTYIFLVMTSYYILKPVRESLFLGEKGYRNLPIAHLLVLAATFVAVVVYTQATRRLGPEKLVTFTNVFFLICIVGFWLFLTQTDTSSGALLWLRGKMAWVYYCWVSVFSVFAMTLFWSVVHTVFTSEKGSRFYGVIGSGATIGALTGGKLTKLLAERFGTENLLLVAACAIAPCIVLGSILARLPASQSKDSNPKDSDENSEKPTSADDTPAFDKRRSTLTIFKSSPYLCVLGLVVMLTIVIAVLDEYRYGELIEANLTGGDERTAFFGNVYFYSNCIGLFFSLVLTGIVQSIWGPRPGMLLYAGLVIASAVAFIVAPNMTTVLYSTIALQAVAYSIFQWSRELLYTQTTAEEKFIAKGFIDTFMFRAGAGAAALALLGAAALGSGENGLLTHAVTHLSWVTIPLGILLAGLSWWISGEFQKLKRAKSAS